MIPLKEQFFNLDLLTRLNEGLSELSLKTLDSNKMIRDYEGLELMDRMHHTADTLYDCIGKDFLVALQDIMILGAQFRGFNAMIFPDIIERKGLRYPDLSLPALAELTQYSSSEFAIRPFIKQDLKGVLKVMEEWSLSSNHHIRRLASEGSRYKLPWSFKIQEFIDQPELTSQIIRNLKQDKELYVRKSVANHLNDLSKEKPEFVLSEVGQWTKNKHSDWITKHALRSLIKAGHKEALFALGIKPVAVGIVSFNIEKPSILLGSELSFSFTITADSGSLLNIDYAIHFMKSNGRLSRKVFKLRKFEMTSGGKKTLTKKHRIEQLSTRKIYAGIHGVSLIINGEESERIDFEVVF
jgi:3-methyladenine DNA glycosylase AlkC